ncbi:MAG TPA: hypothetical protein DCG48_12350 [Rhodospirillaceae bacterium]|nr:hypothetical protein [Rhodospirillaceae bacterium]|tara:strand:+ start:25419 stop:27401 length:1983 start_codon:yes stop_codon:yes gene_type:complete
MCGIFGIILKDRSAAPKDAFEHDLSLLYKASMARGRDATGLALHDSRNVHLIRRDCSPKQMLASDAYRRVVREGYAAQAAAPLAAFGQCRLVTNGSLAIEANNQPVVAGNVVGAHNGIVVNDGDLLPSEAPKTSAGGGTTALAETVHAANDTTRLMEAIDGALNRLGNLRRAVGEVFLRLEGEASIVVMSRLDGAMTLATNTGSLYFLSRADGSAFAFASERPFLRRLIAEGYVFTDVGDDAVVHLKPGEFLHLVPGRTTFDHGSLTDAAVAPDSGKQADPDNEPPVAAPVIRASNSAGGLLRCTACVLPHTYPGISFDDKGVCNFCRNHQHQKVHGRAALEQLLDKHRRNDGCYDCIVGLSGGRDSSYGLHLLKTEYGMNPVAYTYDWGLTTDQSRRNQAIMCSKLGVEHVLRAPDIAKKRRHVRKNINAWLERPRMGMVPLFMAGDKDFYQLGRDLKRDYEVDLTVFCSGSLLEQRQFFVGFCGVHDHVTYTARLYGYTPKVKAQLALYYLSQYLLNPRYINESFFDSVRSFFTSFLFKDDFLYLYEYIDWDEREIDRTLRDLYDWQSDSGYGRNQWRMGDGQTAFTNYIFHAVAGFSEFDNFRSNQIREGLIERDEALKLVEEDNQPKWGALEYFAYVIGINLDEVLARINNIPKLY